jgi:Oxygen-sensitive ribonucleoside-triphosphate reductase
VAVRRLARLKKGEPIDKLLYGGYSTISLGYAGLYECVKYMTGHSHTDDEATPFALSVMQRMNDKCAEWKAAENIDYSLYGRRSSPPPTSSPSACSAASASSRA